jgi:hypothetical protein
MSTRLASAAWRIAVSALSFSFRVSQLFPLSHKKVFHELDNAACVLGQFMMALLLKLLGPHSLPSHAALLYNRLGRSLNGSFYLLK